MNSGVETPRNEIEAALEAAMAAPVPGPEDLFENVYGHSPQRVLQQRAELLSGLPD